MSAEEVRADTRWQHLYATCFPPEETEPLDVIMKSLERDIAVALRARDGHETVGLSFVHMLESVPAGFLVYIGVDPDRRSKAVGSELFRASVRETETYLRRRGREPEGLIWEVDMPGQEGLPPDEREKRERRIGFFSRPEHGGQVLDASYMQPPLAEDAPSVPMHLMFRPSAPGMLPDRPKLEAIVRAMYEEKYGAMNRISTEVLDELRVLFEKRA